MVDLDHDRALYSISVTSELTGVNPQMLRTYESKGLLAPFRTEGGTRRYSGHDVERIGQITTLLETGLNLAGVEQSCACRPKPSAYRPRSTSSAESSAPRLGTSSTTRAQVRGRRR